MRAKSLILFVVQFDQTYPQLLARLFSMISQGIYAMSDQLVKYSNTVLYFALGQISFKSY